MLEYVRRLHHVAMDQVGLGGLIAILVAFGSSCALLLGSWLRAPDAPPVVQVLATVPRASEAGIEPIVLRPATSLATISEQLERIASEMSLGLTSTRIEALAADAGDHAIAVRVQSHLVGEYPGVRRFVQRVLQDDPGVAVERLSIKRDSIENPVVIVEVQFLMHFKRAPYP